VWEIKARTTGSRRHLTSCGRCFCGFHNSILSGGFVRCRLTRRVGRRAQITASTWGNGKLGQTAPVCRARRGIGQGFPMLPTARAILS
jgi:hypothetical protein